VQVIEREDPPNLLKQPLQEPKVPLLGSELHSLSVDRRNARPRCPLGQPLNDVLKLRGEPRLAG
jgi:hypothetical protein